jgi:hypothetical protein
MKVTIFTLDGTEHIHNVVQIIEFESTVVFATADNTEYDSANDFPTMYRFEVTTQTKVGH